METCENCGTDLRNRNRGMFCSAKCDVEYNSGMSTSELIEHALETGDYTDVWDGDIIELL